MTRPSVKHVAPGAGWATDDASEVFAALARGKGIPRDTALRLAADLVGAVADSLDTSGSACECCGFFRYRSWKEKLLYDRLQNIPRRLRGMAVDVAHTTCSRCDAPLGKGDHRVCGGCGGA